MTIHGQIVIEYEVPCENEFRPWWISCRHQSESVGVIDRDVPSYDSLTKIRRGSEPDSEE